MVVVLPEYGRLQRDLAPRVDQLLRLGLADMRADAEPDEDRFSDLSHILFDQAALAAGDSLKDPAAYVQRLNKLLVELSA